MRSKTRLKRKLKKARAMAKKLKVKIMYKKNNTFKYKSLKRLLNDIKKCKRCKGCKWCKRCKRCKGCKCNKCKCKRCKCNKCKCNKRKSYNRFGVLSEEGFDWNSDWEKMPPVSAAKTASESHSTRLYFWNQSTPDEKKKKWIQRLSREAVEQKLGKGTPVRGTELAKEWDRLFYENYKRIEGQMKAANTLRAPARIYERSKTEEESAFGKKNRFG